MLPHDFDGELAELFADDLEHRTALLGDFVVARRLGAAGDFDGGGEPAVFFHAFEQWVECARTDIVPVVAKLFQKPVANHLAFSGVMQDMHFPEGEQDFVIDGLEVQGGVRWSGESTVSQDCVFATEVPWLRAALIAS